MVDSWDLVWVLATFLIFFVAVLYSSIGHAGASGYAAVMALLALPPESIRPTALLLNLAVGALGLLRFWRAGFVSLRKVLPFLLGSMPAVLWATQWAAHKRLFFILLGLLLGLSAIHLLFERKGPGEKGVREPNFFLAVFFGACIGVFSGMTGTGGAIFLTPLLIQAHWAQPREAAGSSVAFVFLNSLVGVFGLAWSHQLLWAPWLPLWLLAAILGAFWGTQLGIFKFSSPAIKRALALVLFIAALKLFYSSMD